MLWSAIFSGRRAVLVMKGVDGNKTRQGLLQLRNRIKKLSTEKKDFFLREGPARFFWNKNSFLRKNKSRYVILIHAL